MTTAAIVGAGIGGLAAALALRQAGWDVRVLERAQSPRELGFALLLAPNAMHALRTLGVADRVAANGIAVQAGEMRRPDGTVLRRMDMSTASRILGEAPIVALRPVLHGALLDAVGAGPLTLGAAVEGFETTPGGVRARTADGATFDAGALVGADGVGSVVRRQLFPQEAPPRASGLWALRGVARGVVSRLGGVQAAQYFGRGIEAGVTQATGDAIYWYLSLRAGLVGASRDPRAVLERAADGFHAPFRDIVLATEDSEMRLDELLERDSLDRWGRGRVTLLGDAAHPMLPHAGQGAAQALEDAVALGRALAGGGTVEERLRQYEQGRSRRAAVIVRLAKRNARMGSLTGRVSIWMRDAMMRHVPERMILKSIVDMGRPRP